MLECPPNHAINLPGFSVASPSHQSRVGSGTKPSRETRAVSANSTPTQPPLSAQKMIRGWRWPPRWAVTAISSSAVSPGIYAREGSYNGISSKPPPSPSSAPVLHNPTRPPLSCQPIHPERLTAFLSQTVAELGWEPPGPSLVLRWVEGGTSPLRIQGSGCLL